MRKTCKRALALVLAVLMLATLAACNKADPTGPNIEKIRNTQAVTVGDYTLSAVDLNYFYIDAVSTFCNQYGSYISYVLDVYKPLSQQIVSEETKQTWADAFLEMAWENVKSTYALYELAVKDGHTLPAKMQDVLDGMSADISEYASKNGYTNVDDYIAELYGAGAGLESYRKYYEVNLMANSYYSAHAESLEYDDAALRAFEQDKFGTYSAYNYTVYYLSAVKFRKGGTEDEKGNITYSDEEKAQAIVDAKAAADALAAGEYADKDAFDAAIKALEINKELASPTLSTAYENVQYAKLDKLFTEWLSSADRTESEITVIEKASGTDDKKVVDGYYVVVFDGTNDNTFQLKNVRHLLVKFEGGTYNSSTGTTTYTEAEKAAAKTEAQKLLAQWEQGDKTEESFADLAAQHTDDGNGDVGGLYEDIYPGQMVEPFETWCYDAERKHGDYGLVETTYGWHIMFFSGDSETTFRDYMITQELIAKDMDKWYEELVKSIELTELDTSYVNKDLTLAG